MDRIQFEPNLFSNMTVIHSGRGNVVVTITADGHSTRVMLTATMSDRLRAFIEKVTPDTKDN